MTEFKNKPLLFLQYLVSVADYNRFSPLLSEMISIPIGVKSYHLLVLLALPHYGVKYKQVQFCELAFYSLIILSCNVKDVTEILLLFINSDIYVFTFC